MQDVALNWLFCKMLYYIENGKHKNVYYENRKCKNCNRLQIVYVKMCVIL